MGTHFNAQAIFPARYLLLCAVLLCIWSPTTPAHSLPGTTLTFTHDKQTLTLSIRMPLEDLLIAAPLLKSISDLPANRELPAEAKEKLATYINTHLQLQQSTAELPMQLVDAWIESAENSDVGTFRQLLLHMKTPLANYESARPLILTYDAIMHEVRSHRATILWATSSTNPVLTVVTEFGFKMQNGEPRPIVLHHP